MNLTQDLRVVSEERGGVGNKPGHDLVVFEIIDHGLRFERWVREGETFQSRRKPFFGTAPEYASYAVNMNRNLKHSFTDRFDHKSGGHSFDLSLTLRFYVDNAERLVLRLGDDPITIVRDEAKRIFGQAVAARSWDEILKGKRSDNFQTVALSICDEHLPELMAIAHDLGITIKGVDLAVGLTADDLAPLVAEADKDRKISLGETADDLAQHERKREVTNKAGALEVEMTLMEREHARDRKRKAHDNELKTLEAQGKVVERGADALITAIHNIASETRTPETLTRSIDAVGRVLHAARAPGAERSLPGGLESRALLPGSEEASGLEALVVEVFRQFGEPARGSLPQLRFLVAIMHWVAELALGAEGNHEMLTYYQESLENPPDDLTTGQHLLLRRLLDLDEMKAKLS